MEIVRLHKENRKSLLNLYREVTAHLRKQGIDQWDWIYPNRFIIAGDIRKGTVYGIMENGRVIGAVAVQRESEEQAGVTQLWSIHRLAVLPQYQGQGSGSRLLRFAENVIVSAGGTHIRLEVYKGNPGAVSLYQRAGYEQTGETRHPFRKWSYFCYEKVLTRHKNQT